MRHSTLTALLVLAVAGSAAAQSVPGGFVVEQHGGTITDGTAMAWSPDGRLFVCEQAGTVRVIKNGTQLATPYHTGISVSPPGSTERGLLGIAFDPNFTVNGYVYIYYTSSTPTIHNCIRRLQPSGNPDVSDGSEAVIVDLETLVATNHNGGAIHFGPDGKLYVAVGENANSANAQSRTTRLGKILRYNADGTIPGDNPTSFPGIAGSTTGVYQAIWAVGLRNPYTFSFQPGTGRMFINDVGEVTWEEINDGIAGTNYGWAGGTTDGVRNTAPFTDPVYVYNHTTGTPNGDAITGGSFYNPGVVQFPASYVGKYFFADYVSSWIYYIDPASPGAATQFLTSGQSPVDIQVGPDGILHYLSRGASRVNRVRYTGSVLQNIIASTNVLSVNEGGSAIFNVRLAVDPGGPLTVTIANTLGSATVTTSAATLNFTGGGGGNWGANQTVTVNAAVDADAFDSGATLTLTSGSLAAQTVVVTALDTNPAPVANRPIARISLPKNGDTVGGATAEFFGNGTPFAGATMTQAAFYIDGVLAYTDVNGTGHFHIGGDHGGFNTTLLSNGLHTLRMTVTDSAARTASHEVTVTVSNASGGGGGGGGGGGCGFTGLEAVLASILAALARRSRPRP